MNPLVVVGSINMDLVVSTARLPRPGETVLGHQFRSFHGGKGANQAVALARLDVPVAMIGKVGCDRFGDELVAGLLAAGVVCDAVERHATASGVALICTEESGENSIVVAPGANGTLMSADIERHAKLIGSASMVLLQLEIPLESVETACTVAHAAGVPVMLDPAPAMPLPQAILQRVEWLTPNETEAAPMLGRRGIVASEEEAREAAQRLLELGAKNIVVKMGRRGSYLATCEGVRALVPAVPVEARDSTAAGDAYNAALAVALLRGSPPPLAARYASAAAAICVTREGAQPAMPTAAEVENFLKSETQGVDAGEKG